MDLVLKKQKILDKIENLKKILFKLEKDKKELTKALYQLEGQYLLIEELEGEDKSDTW